MIALFATAMLAASDPAIPVVWNVDPDATLAPRSFMCSGQAKGISYVVVAKTPNQNFVDFWQKYTEDTEPLKLRIKHKTELVHQGNERLAARASDGPDRSLFLEMWPDETMGLKGRYEATVDGKRTNGECSLIAMLPGYENLK
jgi:hypothetical protein